MSIIKNAIFDWSGVISDSFARQLAATNAIFAQFGAQPISEEELREHWVQPYMAFYHKYIPHLTLEQEQTAYKEAIQKASMPTPCAGMPELLHILYKNNIAMCVISSDVPETLLPEMEQFGLVGVFRDVIANVEDKTASLRELLETHAFEPDATVFIGDSNHEIESGRQVGTKTAAVTWGFCTKARLAALEPDYLVDTAEALKKVFV